MSGGEYLVELLDKTLARDAGDDKATLLIYVQRALDNLEHSWKDIARSYAVLRIHCLKP